MPTARVFSKTVIVGPGGDARAGIDPFRITGRYDVIVSSIPAGTEEYLDRIVAVLQTVID